MAEASDTNISGQTVSVGHHNVTNVVYQALPINPENLPPGARLVYHYTCEVMLDPSAAASSTEEEHHATSQQQQQQQQQQKQQQQQRTAGQPRRQPQQQRTGGKPKHPEQKQHQQHPQQLKQTHQQPQPQQQLKQPHQQPQPQPQPQPQQQQQLIQPPQQLKQQHQQQQSQQQRQQLKNPQQPKPPHKPKPSPQQHQVEEQSKQSRQQYRGQQQLHSQASTGKIFKEGTSSQETNEPSPRQPVHLQSGRPEALEVQGRITTTNDSMAPNEPAVTSQASYCEEPGCDLPYSMYPAMPLDPSQLTYPVQETVQNDGYISVPLSRPSVNSNTGVKTLYSLNPDQCPPETDHTLSQAIEKLRILPKSVTDPAELEVFETRLDSDKDAPYVSDIIVVKLASKPVLVLSDAANNNVKILRDVKQCGDVQSFRFGHAPISLSPVKDGRVLVGFCNVCKISILNLVAMTTEVTYSTGKVYCGIRCVDQSILAACCHQTKSVDILDMRGTLLRSITSASFRKPSFLSASSCISVTDWESNTLSCFTREGSCKFVVSPSGKNSSLGGVIQHGGKIYVADETGNTILCFEESGKKVEVVLSEKDGVDRPRGLAVHSNTLFIGLVCGRVLTWNLPVVMDTRL